MITTQVYPGSIGRSGGVATTDSFTPGYTIISVDGVARIRVENTGDGSRSFLLSTRYADTDVTGDAPFRYADAVAHWIAWLPGHLPPAPATPDATATLLARAQAEGLVARRHRTNPHLALVQSSQDARTWYRVTRTSCTCKAHQHRGICKHRVLALHLAETGRLPFVGRTSPLPFPDQGVHQASPLAA